MRNERVSGHVTLVELNFICLGFFLLEVPGRQVFTSRLWLQESSLLVSWRLVYVPGRTTISDTNLFFLVHLVDADVLLVLSWYLLISVSSGLFERQKICKNARS